MFSFKLPIHLSSEHMPPMILGSTRGSNNELPERQPASLPSPIFPNLLHDAIQVDGARFCFKFPIYFFIGNFSLDSVSKEREVRVLSSSSNLPVGFSNASRPFSASMNFTCPHSVYFILFFFLRRLIRLFVTHSITCRGMSSLNLHRFKFCHHYPV